MLREVFISEKLVGHAVQLPRAFVFLGTRHGQLPLIEKHFGLKIHFLKQVHGDKIVQMHETSELSADGHWTDQTDRALGIYTADCLPVFLHCRKTFRSVAVHAGWRGIQNKILIHAKDLLINKGSEPEDLFVAIGPHISASKFEVEAEVGEGILSADPLKKIKALPHSNKNKSFIPLVEIALNQLSGVPRNQIVLSKECTFSNANYFSHRRQPGEGRLISFIIQK